MDQLLEMYPDRVTLLSVGTSHEGRDMKLLKLSTGGLNKEAIFTDGGEHFYKVILYVGQQTHSKGIYLLLIAEVNTIKRFIFTDGCEQF